MSWISSGARKYPDVITARQVYDKDYPGDYDRQEKLFKDGIFAIMLNTTGLKNHKRSSFS